ncbi:MAG: methyltransferase [Nitrososphaeraceae archaeon]|nr:methyltransferase [Nitrososphaeraceae archaeon]
MVHFLKKVLKDKLTDIEISKLYSSFDIIGEIAIIKIPESIEEKKEIIGNSLMDNIKNVKSVFSQSSPVRGEFRIRDLELIAGKDQTITYYKEHGCIFKVDVRNTYFSPRLSTERIRISNLISDDKLQNQKDVVINMFGGVGTYSIIIAKKNPQCIVYNIDSNIHAHVLCQENAKLNKVENRVFSIFGDAKDVINSNLSNTANRVLMPLPEKAHEFIDEAVLSLYNRTGIIHYFSHVAAKNKKDVIPEVEKDNELKFKSYLIDLFNITVVREVGPRIYQVVSDIKVM